MGKYEAQDFSQTSLVAGEQKFKHIFGGLDLINRCLHRSDLIALLSPSEK